MILTNFSWMPSIALLTCNRSVPLRSIFKEGEALGSIPVEELERTVTGEVDETGAIAAAAAIALLCDIGVR
jgi:hypothetical protein